MHTEDSTGGRNLMISNLEPHLHRRRLHLRMESRRDLGNYHCPKQGNSLEMSPLLLQLHIELLLGVQSQAKQLELFSYLPPPSSFHFIL
jgi:hypothetical protein